MFEAGINYKIKVPMDSGATPELYQPFAMKVHMPYKIQVKIGFRTYLPIEMMGSLKTIGHPGGITRMDLTLGEDTDGDGMPDAWERALLGNGRTLRRYQPQRRYGWGRPEQPAGVHQRQLCVRQGGWASP